MTTSAPHEPRPAVRRIEERYRERRPRSMEAFAQLRRLLPGGETRSVSYFPPFPSVIIGGEGPIITDLDGNRYIDVLNNYTSLVHGHAMPEIVAAIEQAARGGTAFPAPTPELLRFADTLIERFAAIEMVRLTNSGTEAAILALRIVRAATGRRRVLLFEGGYHGTAPPFADADAEAVRIPYNDSDALAGALDSSIAAVFVEPFMGSAGVIPAQPGFIDKVAATAHSVGALVVLDEVQAARNNYRGVQSELDRAPDLVLLGKVIGGGLPIGAVGGLEQHLRLTAADSGVLAHSGTFNGNSASLLAGLASLEALDEPAIARLGSLTAALAAQIEAAGRAAGVPCATTRAGSIMQVHLREHAPVSYKAASATEAELTSTLHLALMDQGVFTAPRGMLNLSTALTQEHLEKIAAAYGCALGELREHGVA